MAELNCWEHRRCGRGPQGEAVGTLGLCPAAAATGADGLNGGTNGGRICWAIAGTFCGGSVAGTCVGSRISCLACEFLRQVRQDTGDDFHLLRPGQAYRAATKATDDSRRRRGSEP